MPLPQINETDVSSLALGLTNIEHLANGGQKVVFSCEKDRQPIVLKFLLVDTPTNNGTTLSEELTMPALDAVTARAKREVDTMSRIDIPTLVKLGPIPLDSVEIRGQPILYFSEERIEGQSLTEILQRDGRLSILDTIQLGCDITKAIEAIWDLRRIHRDIKPSNIISNNSENIFVLLDIGIAFDLQDISITAQNVIVGTKAYLSPDQLEYGSKRRLDFRSDLYALGTVLYEASTGRHPFAGSANTTELLARITSADPTRPTDIRPDIPAALEGIILRLLKKSPHLRYRSCRQLIGQLEQIGVV